MSVSELRGRQKNEELWGGHGDSASNLGCMGLPLSFQTMPVLISHLGINPHRQHQRFAHLHDRLEENGGDQDKEIDPTYQTVDQDQRP